MKRLRETVEHSSREAHMLLLFGLRFSCAALWGAFYLLLQPLSTQSLRIAGELCSLPRGLLLLCAVLCPILEERSRLR